MYWHSYSSGIFLINFVINLLTVTYSGDVIVLNSTSKTILNSIPHCNRSLGGAVCWGTAVHASKSVPIQDVVIGICHGLNSCGRTVAETITRDVFWE